MEIKKEGMAMMKGAIMVPHPPMILPEVGRGEEKTIQTTIDGYREAARFVAGLHPDTIIVSSPHSVMYRDYFHLSPGPGASGSLARFHAGGVKVEKEYDQQLVERIEQLARQEDFPAGTLGERDPELDHATIIPLRFIDEAYHAPYRIIRVGLSGLPLADHYRLGQLIRQAADELGRSAVWVASGDLSHKLQTYGPYGYAPEGPEYDRRIMDVMGSGQFDQLLDFSEDFLEEAAECGHRSFVMMAGGLDGMAVECCRISHQDVTGVGYGITTYRVTGEDPARRFLDRWEQRQAAALKKTRENEDPYVALARQALSAWVLGAKKLPVPSGLPREMTDNRAGTFVSLHENGQLRGCIGTIAPVYRNIAEEIIANAIAAGSRDPRFEPVRPAELDKLVITVDVLGPTEAIASPDQLDPRRYGVVVTRGQQRGLLLPNLDGVKTVDQQLRIAKQKAGLDPDDDDVRLERFEVVRHY
jgi:AmmeMemoRadiSam system protein A